MTRAHGQYLRLNGTPGQRKIADDVQEFVAGRVVILGQFYVVLDAFFFYFHLRLAPPFFPSPFDLPNIFAKASNSFSSITRSTITMALLMSPPLIRLSLYIASSSWRKQKVRHEAISFSNCSKEVMEACWLPNTGEL